MQSKVIFGHQFQVLGKIGSGSFGEIYECSDIATQRKMAIKLEQQKMDQHSQLRYETKIYQILQGASGVCKVYGSGSQDGVNYLVIQKLGQSLDQLLALCKGRFTRKTVLMIADQLITRIEFLHMKGFVHRDIKPNNFMTGTDNKKNTLFIIDFGLAKRYKDFKTSEHIKLKQGKSLVGTARYASIASHEGQQQCRRDDLQSLGYLFIYFLKGSLPWQGVKSKNKAQKFDKIGAMKKSTPLEQLCSDYPEFLEYMKYLRTLSFTDQPDYGYLRKLLRQQFVTCNYTLDCFEWDAASYQKKFTIEIKKK